jgi:DNA-binding transcriptional regulator YdaS (Cro superfamily)
MANKHNQQRNLEIVNLRRQGWTFKAIARLYGISSNRVRQIYERVTKRPDNRSSIEVRVQGALHAEGITPDDLKTMALKDIKQLSGIGEKGLAFIRETYLGEMLVQTKTEQPTHSRKTSNPPSPVAIVLELMKQKGVRFGRGVTKADLKKMSHKQHTDIVKQLESLSDVRTTE